MLKSWQSDYQQLFFLQKKVKTATNTLQSFVFWKFDHLATSGALSSESWLHAMAQSFYSGKDE